jgi:hypothetical protein
VIFCVRIVELLGPNARDLVRTYPVDIRGSFPGCKAANV